MAEEKPADAGAAAEPAKKFDIAKLLPMIILVVNVAIMGGILFSVYKATLGHVDPKVREEQARAELDKNREGESVATPMLYTMEPLVVNLGKNPHILRVSMSLEMLDGDSFEEIMDRSAEVRDQVFQILHKKSFDDLESIQGKLFLKDDIAKNLNAMLRKGVVKDIYFNEFIVQSN